MSADAETIQVSAESTFAMMPTAVLKSDISDRALRTYLVIRSYVRPGHPTFPKVQTMHADFGLSESYLKRGISELKRAGFIQVGKIGYEGSKVKINSYHLPNVPDAPVKSDPLKTRLVDRGVKSDPSIGVKSDPSMGVKSDPLEVDEVEVDEVEVEKHTAPRGADTADAVTGEFEQWYAVYPRKAKRPQAQAAFAKARKKASFETLMEGAHRWANAGIEKQFTPYPASWLNGAQWEDEPPLPRNGRPSTMDRMMKLQAMKGQNTQWTTPQTTPRALPGMM